MRVLTYFRMPTCTNTVKTKLHPRGVRGQASAHGRIDEDSFSPPYLSHPEVQRTMLFMRPHAARSGTHSKFSARSKQASEIPVLLES